MKVKSRRVNVILYSESQSQTTEAPNAGIFYPSCEVEWLIDWCISPSGVLDAILLWEISFIHMLVTLFGLLPHIIGAIIFPKPRCVVIWRYMHKQNYVELCFFEFVNYWETSIFFYNTVGHALTDWIVQEAI